MTSIEQILRDVRADAATLRRAGNAGQADYLDRLAAEIEAAAEEYTRFVSESDAAMRSGKAARWFRDRFSAWAEEGHAELRGRVRYYRLVIVPLRVDTDEARAAGERAAERRAS